MKLVLLPGLDGTGELFEPFAMAMVGVDCRVVRYPVDRTLDYAGHAAFARETLPDREPFVLLGESFSGPVAIAIAAKDPPGLRGVVLCCSFASNPLPALAPLRRLISAAPAVKLPSRWFAPWLFARHGTPELRRAYVRAMSRVSAATLRARVAAVLSVDVREQLRQVAVPMLYLQATADRLIPGSALREIQRMRGDLRVARFEAPHFLLQTRPRECAGEIREFLDSLAIARHR
jgi:pimeloyl-ACP methyl ester carboxylesterase